MAKLGRASSHVRIQTAASKHFMQGGWVTKLFTLAGCSCPMCSKHFYVGRKIDGHSIDLLDSPGVGDQDVTPMAVLTLIERVNFGRRDFGRSTSEKHRARPEAAMRAEILLRY